MPKMIFVNLPVKDLPASTRFYEAIGCVLNPQFSNESASSMVWSDEIVFQLLDHDYYQTFTTLPIHDPRAASGALFALSRDSRAEVDAMVEAAGRAGGTADVREPQDMGWMYLRTFADPDGNVFEPAYMDMAAAAQAHGG
jgi:predicted lactoylglutathione lyase